MKAVLCFCSLLYPHRFQQCLTQRVFNKCLLQKYVNLCCVNRRATFLFVSILGLLDLALYETQSIRAVIQIIQKILTDYSEFKHLFRK